MNIDTLDFHKELSRVVTISLQRSNAGTTCQICTNMKLLHTSLQNQTGLERFSFSFTCLLQVESRSVN